jgi:hypothetical protein
VALPPAAKFELQADAQRGEIENEFGGGLKQTGRGNGANLSGSVGQGPLVRLETDRGTITLRKATATDALSNTAPPSPAEAAAPPEPPRAPKRIAPPVTNHRRSVEDLQVQTQ